MTKHLVMFLAIFIIGCNQQMGAESEIKEIVKSNLRNPNSARFFDFAISDSYKSACILWQAGDGLGVARLKQSDSGWVIEHMDAGIRCTTNNLNAHEKEIKQNEELRKVLEKGSDYEFLDVRRKAESGDPDAQNNVGAAYAQGKWGLPKDAAKALEWFQKAAAQGYADAQFNLGLMYDEKNDDIPRDAAKAVEWYMKAAAQGVVKAQYKLGLLYIEGDGVSKDMVHAYAWLNLAAEQGSDEGKKGRDLMKPTLTPTQRAEGKRLASNWKVDILQTSTSDTTQTLDNISGDLATTKKAETKPGKVFRDCPDCPEMVILPTGSFEMGSNEGRDNEKPIHRVTISSPFLMGKTEVTQGQWKAIMGNNPSFFENCGDNCPVENISWDDAQEFIRKLNAKTGKQYRLPSESEWEYACRAGGQHQYCGSDNLDSIGWYGALSKLGFNSSGTINQLGSGSPVGLKQANAFGLYDMTGNVAEFIDDGYHDSYAGAPTDGSSWKGNGAKRVFRGGDFSGNPQQTRAAIRYGCEPTIRAVSLGFRLARTLP